MGSEALCEIMVACLHSKRGVTFPKRHAEDLQRLLDAGMIRLLPKRGMSDRVDRFVATADPPPEDRRNEILTEMIRHLLTSLAGREYVERRADHAAVRALVAALPVCDECGLPATWIGRGEGTTQPGFPGWRAGVVQRERCDQCWSSDEDEPVKYAAPLRALLARVGGAEG